MGAQTYGLRFYEVEVEESGLKATRDPAPEDIVKISADSAHPLEIPTFSKTKMHFWLSFQKYSFVPQFSFYMTIY